jgi:hypothetical protein
MNTVSLAVHSLPLSDSTQAATLASRVTLALLWAVAIFGAFSVWQSFSGFIFEDAYITYRYADNIAQGRGFVFTAGERVLGTTAPLYTLIFSVLGWIGIDIPTGSGVIFVASLGLVGVLGGAHPEARRVSRSRDRVHGLRGFRGSRAVPLLRAGNTLPLRPAGGGRARGYGEKDDPRRGARSSRVPHSLRRGDLRYSLLLTHVDPGPQASPSRGAARLRHRAAMAGIRPVVLWQRPPQYPGSEERIGLPSGQSIRRSRYLGDPFPAGTLPHSTRRGAHGRFYASARHLPAPRRGAGRPHVPHL